MPRVSRRRALTHEHVAVNSALLNRMQKDGIVIKLFESDRLRGLANVDRIFARVFA